MKIKTVEKRSEALTQSLLEIWEASVRETHHFLSSKEITTIKQFVPGAIMAIPHLIVLENDKGRPLAFMGIAEQQLEMLFVAPTFRGQGLGRKLLEYGMKTYKVNRLTVNEQNPEAKGFYEHMGFSCYKRTETDEQGLPYPILYMKKMDR
ncbi:GNAT family N-acetyltransferase [Lactococcus garvieae]|jgi:putative acetyltransferase|uniref:Histone acetyltransferase HPA2-like protein n=1 Tax=Lactococcus garvieae DCC43 TaxID=1231377 RepID=K2NS35_9LACT|nr:GNAT family N-acetyltransferase [Lactococcus garvieae]EKF50398.1 Histone acetyltransferase HPA2 -like protein [Lactococcus garvieae DCC43]